MKIISGCLFASFRFFIICGLLVIMPFALPLFFSPIFYLWMLGNKM